MGTTNAIAMAEAVADGLGSIEQALTWHLQHNHYPPVPLIMLDVCIAAIEAAECEEWDVEIDLPEHVSYRGRTSAPAWAIVKQHHLDAFIGAAS